MGVVRHGCVRFDADDPNMGGLFGGAFLLYIASGIETGSDTIWGEGGGDKSRVQIQR